MAKLYIKVDENNIFIDHPHFESNVRRLYPDHDFSSGPPSGWMEFVRSAPPKLGVYQKFDSTKGGDIALAFDHNGLEYKIVDGVYKDVWHVLDMTDEEKLEKQNAVKNDFTENYGYASWTFNEETCSFDPPSPRPGAGYVWNDETETWEQT